MAVLVYVDNLEGVAKKASFEAISYGKACATNLGVACHALTIGKVNNLDEVSTYGADTIHQINSGDTVLFDSKSFAKAISDVAETIGATLVIMAHNSQGKSVAGRVAVRCNAGLITAVNELPTFGDGVTVKRGLFSEKATGLYKSTAPKNVFTLMGNAYTPVQVDSASHVEDSSVVLDAPAMEILATETVKGEVPLPEAESVVSAGRGMKGPENWGIIDELAEVLGATTACSRPVADVGWRPHHEHVGQTGIAIRPNLYIAIGISGAIQHLAGVNNSKVIVVINKDPEAPFFKAADYGVVGDLFDVVPKLTAALKAAKA